MRSYRILHLRYLLYFIFTYYHKAVKQSNKKLKMIKLLC
uniref:Uncharacterized protein n=1 Tax=Myoviridae sp. ctzwE5 TaxID=2825214 RepID=A0A8S5PWW3_9CAUD|nr:MAG TPA: hypothetical protein [Myoviridae sp. ctzwE5]